MITSVRPLLIGVIYARPAPLACWRSARALVVARANAKVTACSKRSRSAADRRWTQRPTKPSSHSLNAPEREPS